MFSTSRHSQLDQFTLDIEFLLISVVQGIALSVLATSSIEPISQLNIIYWPYIISAFLVLFLFWAQAIIHALSFIDWPLDLSHNFLYFLVSFVQVLSFSKVTDPLHWFSFMSGFFAVAIVLYYVDYQLIRKRESKFNLSAQGKELYKHILSQHVFEMKILAPLGFIFNTVIAFLIWKNPYLMLTQHYHVLAICLQGLFMLSILLNAVWSFKKRSILIEEVLT